MERTWLQQYDASVSAEIDAGRFTSVLDIFEYAIGKYGDKTAFINMGQSLTFKELAALSEQFASHLQNSGLQRGDAIAIMMPNLLQYPIALFGILRAGMTVVNVNPLYTPRELKHQLNDANVKAIIILDNFAHTLESVITETPVKRVLITSIGDMLPAPKRWVVKFAVRYVKKMVPQYKLPTAEAFMQAVDDGCNYLYKRPEIDSEEIAFLQYTGGTTGLSKGAMLTHRNMVANIEQVSGILETIITPGEELVVTALPLYHIFALLANCLLFVKYGCASLLITNPRDMPGFMKELKRYPFTILPGVNTLFNGLLNQPEFAQLDFSNFKFGLGGGMAVQAPVAEKWQKVTGTVLLEGYGLTEASPVVTVNPPSIPAYRGSIGIPVPSTDIRLLDDNGNEVPLGEPGEMWVKGPQIMKGYWNAPESTAEVLKDGWLATGDIARADADGFFYIVDRKKDMILVSGFNVFPNEIEEVVAMHEHVLEAAAVGVPHEVSGEVVKLFVVKKDESLTAEHVIAHCRDHLTAYKVPKHVIFKEELPKTNVGKILRRELRE